MKLTIRTRLTIVYSAIFCAGMVTLETGTYFGLRASINTVVDRELQARLIGVVDFIDNHVMKLSLPRFQADLAGHGSLMPGFLTVVDLEKGEIFQSPAMREISLLRKAPPSSAIWTTQLGQIPVRVLIARQKIRGRSYELRLGTDLSGSAEVVRYFRLLLFLLAPMILACAAAAGYFISGRALAPVSELSRAARTIGAPNLKERVKVHRSGDEIEELATTFNGMLARIEDAFRHVKQFTADASHELRTPLAVMRATAEVALLRSTGNAESYREALHRILSEAERNTSLLDDLLRLARVDSDPKNLSLRRLNLAKKMTQACERANLLAREKNIVLSGSATEEGAGALEVSGDADYLLRLCLILLDNAIKYTPPGGTVIATVKRSAAIVSLEVRDTGIGILPEDLTKIFGRFYRTEGARTSEPGAGLGLAIARSIVEAHHATIHVDSIPGKGTAFRVDFPALEFQETTHGTSKVHVSQTA